jgi:hypothetical protein
MNRMWRKRISIEESDSEVIVRGRKCSVAVDRIVEPELKHMYEALLRAAAQSALGNLASPIKLERRCGGRLFGVEIGRAIIAVVEYERGYAACVLCDSVHGAWTAVRGLTLATRIATTLANAINAAEPHVPKEVKIEDLII